MPWPCPACRFEGNEDSTIRCLCGFELESVVPVGARYSSEHNPCDAAIVTWNWIIVVTYPVSAFIGSLFTFGQDGAGAGMGFGVGLIIGFFLFSLPASFRLAYLLRSASQKKIKKNHQLFGKIVVSINFSLLLIILAMVLAEILL